MVFQSFLSEARTAEAHDKDNNEFTDEDVNDEVKQGEATNDKKEHKATNIDDDDDDDDVNNNSNEESITMFGFEESKDIVEKESGEDHVEMCSLLADEYLAVFNDATNGGHAMPPLSSKHLHENDTDSSVSAKVLLVRIHFC